MSNIHQKNTDLSAVVRVECAATLKSEIEQMVSNDPRFAGLAKYMEGLVFWWTRQIDTACAGHGFIFFNPEFYESLPEETRKTIIAHEVWHLILKHLERGEDFEPEYYNIAADHVINLMLEEEGFTFEGSNPCKDPQYANMSTEQIYQAIYVNKPPEERPQVQPGKNSSPEKIKELIEAALGQGQSDENGDPVSGNPDNIDDQKAKNDQDIARKMKPGDMPGNQGIHLDRQNLMLVIEGVPYEKIFEDYLIDPLGGGKRSYMRPNRRQQGLSRKLILPGRLSRKGEKNRLTHLVYALDVSGSISRKQVQQFHDSVGTIKQMLHPKKLTVLFFDTKIRLEKTYEDTEPYDKINVVAGGGTCLNGVYKRTAELAPEALVIFTDLCVTIPPKPSWETIWLVPFKGMRAKTGMYGTVYLIPEEN